MNGLSITLVKADGTVHGPCRRCRRDVVLVEAGTLSKSIDEVMPRAAPPRRRVVFVVDSED